jgi:hypothetical protein
MLGEIFGLRAGLMSVEQELFRFFDVRASFGSSLLPFSMGNAGLVGVVTLSIIGLGRPDMVAPGVWSAASLGVFRAAIRGVSWSSTRTAVSSLDSAGRSNEGSGRVKSSIMGGPSRESPKFGEGWMRISEAGVAGVAGVPPWPFIWAIMAGDAVWEPGMGGGRISDSSGSGEMESVSEVSRLWGTSRPFEGGRPPRASSRSSLTSLGGINEDTVAFRRPGFTMGDCRTQLLAFADRGALLLLLRSFRPVSCCIMGSPRISISTSMGEWPVELPEGVACECWCACWLFCALSAGEVRGLK